MFLMIEMHSNSICLKTSLTSALSSLNVYKWFDQSLHLLCNFGLQMVYILIIQLFTLGLP